MLKTKDFKQDDTYEDGYAPNEDEQTKISYVDTRFKDMQQSRSIVDKDWDIYQTMIDAIFSPYPDERSSSTVPLASTLIELYVAEAMKLETEFDFRGETSEYATQAKALEYVWKYDRRKQNRKKTFLENEYITAGFGTSVLFTGFEYVESIQHDFVEGGKLFNDGANTASNWKKRTVDKSKILVDNCDIRQYYLDNQALRGIEEASDCIYDQWISREKFENLKDNRLYKNLNAVRPKQYSTEYKQFVTQEEAVTYGDFVKLRHYWNVDKDAYMVFANGVLIREHYMMSTIDGAKALPFVIRNLGKKNYSIYGRGLCEALMMFNSEINNLRELLMDGIRRSNTQVLALGNGLSFDGRSFSYDNEILTFDGNLANNFQQISGNPPNQAIFSYLERLYKDIAMFIGIDVQNILGEPQQTAFQTEVQREASQKRVNVWLMNRDLAFERFANLYKDLLQTHFPRKTAEGLYPKIEIEDEEVRNGKFRKKKGKYLLEVTPETLRGDIYVDAYTNVSAPTINAVDREQKLGLVKDVSTIAQGYAIAKQAGFDIEKIMPLNATLEDLAADYNLNTQPADDDENIKEKKQELSQKLQGMKVNPANKPMPEGPTEQPQQMQQQPLQPNPQQGQNI